MQQKVLDSLLGIVKSLEVRLLSRIEALEKREPVAGRDGKDGTSVSVGIGGPTFSGRTGDVYIDANTGDIYQCR